MREGNPPSDQTGNAAADEMRLRMEVEEYKEKWAYIRHTELLQNRQLQWYFAVVAGVLVFIYGGEYKDVAFVVGDPWIPLSVLVVFSVLYKLRLLRHKRNYDDYITRINELEGREPDPTPLRRRVLSVFKLQYYGVVLVGAVVVTALVAEFTESGCLPWLLAALYAIGMCALSFTSLIGD